MRGRERGAAEQPLTSAPLDPGAPALPGGPRAPWVCWETKQGPASAPGIGGRQQGQGSCCSPRDPGATPTFPPRASVSPQIPHLTCRPGFPGAPAAPLAPRCPA